MLVVRVTEERFPHAAGVLAHALLDDPMVRWSLGGTAQDYADRVDLEDRMTKFFTIANGFTVARGVMWEAEGSDGVCVWLPPSVVADYARDDVAILRPRLAAIGFGGTTHHGSMWDWIDERTPPERLWCLDQLGVEPAAQGRGIGSVLVEHGLAMAREAGEAAFLETGTPRNVAYYERFGFRTVEDADAPDGGPHIWFMRREP